MDTIGQRLQLIVIIMLKDVKNDKDFDPYKRFQLKRCMKWLSLDHLGGGPWMLLARFIQLHPKDAILFW